MNGPSGPPSQLIACGLVCASCEPVLDNEAAAEWAQCFRGARFAAESFNTLHKCSSDISTTPFVSYVIPELLNLLAPVLRKHFGLAPADLSFDSGFFISYEEDANKALRRHMDKCIFTINVSLEEENIAGTAIRFYGRQPLHSNDLTKEDENECWLDYANFAAGSAVLHWGQHEHETLPWRSGMRSNVILWFRHSDNATWADLREAIWSENRKWE